jgi:hypothetical protein
MIAALLSLLGSSAVGSIIGGIFAFLNKKTDLDVRRLELDHETRRWTHDLALRDKDLDLARLEAQGKLDVAVIEGEATTETARMTAIAASHQADKISADELRAAGKYRWMLVVGSAMRAWIRPTATVVLVAAAIYLNGLLLGKLTDGWSALTPAQQYEAAMQAFAWITGQASAALGYWFVSRGTGK